MFADADDLHMEGDEAAGAESIPEIIDEDGAPLVPDMGRFADDPSGVTGEPLVGLSGSDETDDYGLDTGMEEYK
jgi:hypothetical protein